MQTQNPDFIGGTAIVVLSGGQDSTTCAAIAKQRHDKVHAVVFSYGQRHSIEVQSAMRVATMLGLDSYEIINTEDALRSTSPLLSEREVETYESEAELPDGIASTFVPARNALFLTIAFNRAVLHGAEFIYTGVNQTDSSGYPDCRERFIEALEETLNYGTFGAHDEGKHITFETPLINLTKAQTVELSLDQFETAVAFECVFAETHTCYQGVKGGCGKCAACLLRDKGFNEAGVKDPIWKYRSDSPAA